MWTMIDFMDSPMNHEQRFHELSEKEDIYGTFPIDEETKKALLNFFYFDRLCDRPEKFKWFWKRNLMLYYPIYKNQMDMWKERTVYEWFYDNFKDTVTTHDGQFRMTESDKRNLVDVVDRTIKEIFNGNIDSSGTSDGTINARSNENGESSNQYNDTTNGKSRNFMFNYPESNYQGGVIPYDLSNNPNVEFIDNQSDSINSGSQNHVGSDEFTNSANRDTTTHEETSANTKTDNVGDRTENENRTQDTTDTKEQGSETDWVQTVKRQGDNISDIAMKIIEQLPLTDFFKQFTDRMKVCFQNTYLPGEEY